MRAPYTYANVKKDEPAGQWANLQLVNSDTREVIDYVVEVDCEKGWAKQELIVYAQGTPHKKVKKIYGNFHLEYINPPNQYEMDLRPAHIEEAEDIEETEEDGEPQ